MNRAAIVTFLLLLLVIASISEASLGPSVSNRSKNAKVAQSKASQSTVSSKPESRQLGVIAAIGSQLNFEYGPNGRTLQTRQPWSLRAGLRHRLADLYFEYSSFEVADGTPLVQVTRTHREFTGWARRSFFQDWRVRPFVAGGLGAQYDVVRTDFAAETSRDVGSLHFVMGTAAGILADVTQNIDVALEGRAAMSNNYAPNPMLGFALNLGFRF